MNIKNNTKSSRLIIGPAVAVDLLIFSIKDEKLKVLLLNISQGPYKNKWALPGALVGINVSLDDSARDVLENKAGIKGIHLEQLYAFGAVNRDSRGRSVSVAYMALVDSDKHDPKTTDYYSEIKWIDVARLPGLAFDHRDIVNYGIDRLRGKLEYSNIAFGLLPKEFTLPEMKNVYEIILGIPVDKRNFYKKIKQLNILDETNKESLGPKNKPAKLYKFKKRTLILTK